MGAAESKLQFKNHIFRLSETRNIPADDEYWEKFWQHPLSASDVFSLFTANDIRTIRDASIENLRTLTIVVSNKLLELSAQNYDSSLTLAQVSKRHDGILNCLRILTRILPFWFEAQTTSPTVGRLVKGMFWNTDSNDALACRLIDSVTKLLFEEQFCIPKNNDGGSGDHVIIWSTGIGSSKSMTATHDLISHRVEVLRFLLTLASDSLYMTPTGLATYGSPYLTYMVTRDSQHEIMAVLCSLLNTCMNYNPGWNIPYQHMLISDRNRQLVTYCLQYLTLLFLCSPSRSSLSAAAAVSNDLPKNYYRYYMSKIHNQKDLEFLADSLRRLLSQPISASSSYLLGSQKQDPWVIELSMMLWDLIQCNKKFRNYILKSGHIHDFAVLVVYYACDRSMAVSRGLLIMRLSAYILLYLTSHRDITRCLCEHKFQSQGAVALPEAIRKISFNASYADYLVVQLVQTILASLSPSTSNSTNSSGSSGTGTNSYVDLAINSGIGNTVSAAGASSGSNGSSVSGSASGAHTDHLHNTTTTRPKKYDFETLHVIQIFISCIYNISPYVSSLSYTTASSLINLFLFLQSAQNEALPAKQRHSTHILRCIVLMINYHFKSNKKLIFLILKNEAALRSIFNDLSAKLKNSSSSQIAATGTSNQSPSTLQDLQHYSDTLQMLEFVLDIVDSVKSQIPYADYFVSDFSNPKLQPHAVIESIGMVTKVHNIDVNSHEPTDEFESVKFVWDTDSFGWYESILWGNIFQTESEVLPHSASIHDTAMGNYNTNVGIWNGTHIQLFKLKEVSSAGVSIFHPKGAVDAVADTVLDRFSKLISIRRGPIGNGG